ncbi:type II toxin-antitoxin system VapC family toxin [Sorangium sp. So ce145]|uniref:type II toxin-antitoxin system VapC family toxin n=1 Tax=Sorangium sp. So ce145 TaxID=3133285 RepID=UPI003F5F8F3C
MGALIDSSVLIAAERGKLDFERVLRDHGDEPVAIAAITASELLHGVHRAVEASQRARREAFVERLLADLSLISFDLVAARVHARLSAELAAKGSPVGAHDLLIAATALAVGYDVATRDARSFPRIPGLRVLHW